jgi:hypothetical protein
MSVAQMAFEGAIVNKRAPAEAAFEVLPYFLMVVEDLVGLHVPVTKRTGRHRGVVVYGALAG